MALFASAAFAQDAATSPAAPAPAPFEMPVMILLMLVIFYFLLIRPQQRNARIHREMIGGIKRGDRVVTGGGIFGTVTKVGEGDSLEVEIASGVVVEVARGTLISVAAADAAPAAKPAERQPKARKAVPVDTATKIANDN